VTVGQDGAVAATARVTAVGEDDLPDLLPLMRAYCDFYAAAPSDDALLALARAMIQDPLRDGIQLLARDGDGRAVGFATVFWSWSTVSAARIGVMNDLYVAPEARGTGLADALIEACADLCRRRGDIARLGWQTATDNHRAQAVYDRVGAARSEWIDYSISLL
jgi:GNAT superfamily N-acetyltransferase